MTFTKKEYAIFNKYTLDLFQSITSGAHTEKQYKEFVAKRQLEYKSIDPEIDRDQKRWNRKFHSVWHGSLKRIPLFINDADETIRGIAKARLLIGR